ncbi:MAG: AAA family ATPase [Steroidobacteraceae bacterium]
MYTSFFGLIEKPFAITPDPRYLYLSERHAEALAHLLYGINEAGGFIQLTGEVGTGKTTIVRTLLSRVPQHADVAVILNPRVTATEFLLTICEELGLGLDEADRTSAKEMVDALNRRLLAAHAEGRRVIIIVDEAQNLSTEVLEQVRLLTNLETATQKLLQIILIGQPELRELLDRSELRQLAQRITGRYHLNPLFKAETQEYVGHRLRVAGAAGEIFTPAALREVYRLSSGIPRVINVCCDRALLGAYTLETRKVTPALVRRAAGEVYGRRFVPLWLGWVAAAIVIAGVAITVYAGIAVWRNSPPGLRSATNTPVLAPAGAALAQPSAPPAGAAAAAAAPAPAPAEKPVPLQTLLEANAADTSDAGAFRRLLSLWGTAMADDRDPCGQAQKAGLACLEQRGSWAQVRALNRPAILTLNDDRGRRYRVVLSALDDSFATLDLGERNVRVPIDELSRDWFGDFTCAAPPPIRSRTTSTTRSSRSPCRTFSASTA